MRRSIITILMLLAILLPGVARAQHTPVPPIEKLVYMGYYNWGFIWIKAGRVEFTQQPSDKYPDAQFLQAVGHTTSTWDEIFMLRDTLYSHFDNTTFKPYEFSRKAHEGKYHKTFDYTFDYADSVIYGDINRIGRWQKNDTTKMEANLYDMLSIAWYARGLDYSNYKEGDKIPIKIFLDSEVCDLYIRYLGKDKFKLAGTKHECYVFAPLLVAGEVFKGGENMKVWVTADEKRIPLLVESKIIVGSVKGILVPQESIY